MYMYIGYAIHMFFGIIEGLCDEFSGQLSGQRWKNQQKKKRKAIKTDDIYYVFCPMLFNGFLNAI